MIKIIGDSTCDLTKEILERYDISIAPLSVLMEGKEYQDRVNIEPDQLYSVQAHLKENPTTGAPSPEVFAGIMKEAYDKGEKEILCICMSSGTSGTCQSAMIGMELFLERVPKEDVKVHVVDSLSMSHGSGYLLLKSAMLREEGWSFSELVEFNEQFKKRVKHFLSVDDLDNLIRSGRLSNASAIIGKLLKVKPIMSMRDGKGAIVDKVRGRKGVLDRYLREFIDRVDREMTDFVIVGYTSDIAYANNLKLMLQEEGQFSGEIFIMQMGVAVGTHVGLGGLSLFFIEKPKMHDGLLTNEMKNFAEKRNEILQILEERRNRKKSNA